MWYRLIFLAFFLAFMPQRALAQERLVCQSCAYKVPVLSPPLALTIGGAPVGRSQYAHRKFTRWTLISAGVLGLGTATLLTGVRLFNTGNNAKKNAAGDTLINVGVGVNIAAVLPLGVAGWWWRSSRR